MQRYKDRGLYSSRIANYKDLIMDTNLILDAWDPNASVSDNFRRIQYENLLGKSSRSRVRSILLEFKRRFVREVNVVKALRRFLECKCDVSVIKQILYFHTVRSDILLSDVIEFLFWRKSIGYFDIDDKEILSFLRKRIKEGKTRTFWKDSTICQTAKSVLLTLDNFGILIKRDSNCFYISPFYLSIFSFAYIAFYLYLLYGCKDVVFNENNWKMFFLTFDDIERLLFKAHQHGLLEYYVVGSIVRLTFPVSSIEDYVELLL